MTNRALPIFALCSLLPAINWSIVPSQIANITPEFSVGYRFVLAGILLLLFCQIRYRHAAFPLTKKNIILCTAQGFFLFCLSFNLLYTATQHIVTGLVSVISSMIIVPTLLRRLVIYRQRPSYKEFTSALVGVLGVYLLFLPDLNFVEGSSTLWGILIAFCAMFCTLTGYNISEKMMAKKLNVFWTTGYAMLSGGIFSIILALIFNKGVMQFDTSATYFMGLVYSAIISSGVAFCLYFILTDRIGANKASYVWIIVPLIALNLSAIFEDFIWTRERLLGCSLIVLGGLILRSKFGAPKLPNTPNTLDNP